MTMLKIIKPNKLKPGDLVGIISPSHFIWEELKPQFEKGLETIKSLGLRIKLGDHIFDRHHYSAGSREDRLSDFNKLWKDPEVKMILMTIGGATANHLLDGIDYDYIRGNPKIFCGISDGTTLLNAIHQRTGMVAFHGPDLIFTFGQRISPLFIDHFKDVLFEGKVRPLQPNPDWHNAEDKNIAYRGWQTIRPGKAKGRLLGGHVASIINLLAAGYMPDFRGALLFLECTYKIEALDKMLNSLRLRGVFDQIAGLIIGWFDGCERGKDGDQRSVADLFMEVIGERKLPVLEIGELGHYVENYIFPIGCLATLDADNQKIVIEEEVNA